MALNTSEIAALAKGLSPLLIRPTSLVFYLPLVRDADRDVVGGLALTAFNVPTVGDHTKIFNPAPRVFWNVPAAAGGRTRPMLVTGPAVPVAALRI